MKKKSIFLTGILTAGLALSGSIFTKDNDSNLEKNAKIVKNYVQSLRSSMNVDKNSFPFKKYSFLGGSAIYSADLYEDINVDQIRAEMLKDIEDENDASFQELLKIEEFCDLDTKNKREDHWKPFLNSQAILMDCAISALNQKKRTECEKIFDYADEFLGKMLGDVIASVESSEEENTVDQKAADFKALEVNVADKEASIVEEVPAVDTVDAE